LTVQVFCCAPDEKKIAATAAVMALHSLARHMLVEGPCEFADSRLLAAFRLGGIRVSSFNFVQSEAPLVMSQTQVQTLLHQLLSRAGRSKSRWTHAVPTLSGGLLVVVHAHLTR